MIAMMALQLVALYSGLAPAGWAVDGLVLALPLIGLPLLKLREAYLFSDAGLLSLLALVDGTLGAEIFLAGLERAGYLASFVMPALNEELNIERAVARSRPHWMLPRQIVRGMVSSVRTGPRPDESPRRSPPASG